MLKCIRISNDNYWCLLQTRSHASEVLNVSFHEHVFHLEKEIRSYCIEKCMFLVEVIFPAFSFSKAAAPQPSRRVAQELGWPAADPPGDRGRWGAVPRGTRGSGCRGCRRGPRSGSLLLRFCNVSSDLFRACDRVGNRG